jgi:O-glycosyl hydrolase
MAITLTAASNTAIPRHKSNRVATIARRISNGAVVIVSRATRGRSTVKSIGVVNACVSRRLATTTSATTAVKVLLVAVATGVILSILLNN